MANRFRTSVLILGGEKVTTTGNLLYVNDILIGGSNVDLSGLISTGNADLRYYSITNPSGYLNTLSGLSTGYVQDVSGVLSNRLGQTGSDLLSLIIASSAGVTSLNGLSGILDLIGAGSVTIQTGIGIITISGKTVNLNGYITTGDADLRYYSITNPDGYINEAYADSNYYSITNPDGYVTESDADLSYYSILNPAGYITNSGFALISFVTGVSGTLQSQITNINNNTGLFYLASNPSGFITGINSGDFYLSSNPQGYVTSGDLSSVSGILNNKINASSAGVASLNDLSGQLVLEGRGNITISTGAGTIYISGTDISGSDVNLSGYITTGDADLRYYTKNNESGFLNSLSGLSTGYIQDISGVLSIRLESTGQQNWLSSNSNSINLSGNLQTTGANLYILITGSSGYATITYATISNLALTGQSLFNLITGLSGDLETQINNLTLVGGGVTGISITGGNSITGKVSFTGIGGLQLIQIGNEIRISGGISNSSTVDLSGYITTGDADLRYYSITNPSNFCTSGNLQNTGQSLISLINGLSGQLNITGSLLAPKYLGNPTDGAYGGTNGAIAGIAAGDLHEDAFDKVEVILGKLAPAKPGNLSAVSFTLLNTAYSGYEQGSSVGSTNHTNIINGYFPTGRATGFYDADEGILSGLINSIVTGTRTLWTGSDIGIYSGLVITADADYYSGQAGKAGFWNYLSAHVSPSGRGLNSGEFTLQLRHSTTGPTTIITGHCDGPRTPTVSVTDVRTGICVPTIIDGVPYLKAGDKIYVDVQLTNVVSAYYRSPIATITTNPLVTSSVISINATGSPLSGSLLNLSGLLTIDASKYSAGVVGSSTAYNIVATTATDTSSSTVRVDSLSSQPAERVTASSGLYPILTTFGNTYNDDILLTTAGNEELQLINAKIQYPSLTDYSAGIPAGPDYRNMPSGSYSILGTGYRWACFNMGTITDKPAIKLTFNDTSNFGSLTNVPGLLFNVRVSGTNPTNGWVDANTGNYDGVSTPTNNGDLALAYANSSPTLKYVNFSVIRNGTVFARVGIPSGSNKSFGSLTLTLP